MVDNRDIRDLCWDIIQQIRKTDGMPDALDNQLAARVAHTAIDRRDWVMPLDAYMFRAECQYKPDNGKYTLTHVRLSIDSGKLYGLEIYYVSQVPITEIHQVDGQDQTLKGLCWMAISTRIYNPLSAELPHAVNFGSSVPDDLRALGYRVAVHNDYRLHDENYTFWLMTCGERAVKGEGHTDAEALDEIRKKIQHDPAELAQVECDNCGGSMYIQATIKKA